MCCTLLINIQTPEVERKQTFTPANASLLSGTNYFRFQLALLLLPSLLKQSFLIFMNLVYIYLKRNNYFIFSKWLEKKLYA